MGVREASERYTVWLTSLSRVTSPLAAKLIDEYLAEQNLAGLETKPALFVTLVTGYSTLGVVAGRPSSPACVGREGRRRSRIG